MMLLRIALQIFGLLVLLLGATLITLKLKHQNADGPSTLFPGGELVSGQLYAGPEPDWTFTDDIFTIELQTATSPKPSPRALTISETGKE